MKKMTIEEHNNYLTQLRALSDTPEMATIVQALQSDYAQMTNDLNTSNDNLKKAKETADKYAKLNNDLFLQCSAQNKLINNTNIDTQQTQSETGQEPPKKLTYEDLEKEF